MTEEREMRKVYCEELLKIAEQDERLVILDADLMMATGTIPFKDKFPERTVDCGVCEANMMGVAAGLSAIGKLPIAHTFTPFATRRAYDQIVISIAYAGLNVKICGTDPGISAQLNGGTHMSLEDVGIMRNIPGMTIIEPVDTTQLKQALPHIINHDGPVYFRLFRKNAEKVFGDDYKFEWGKADVIKEGTDITILATSIMVRNALDAAELLEKEGISAEVVGVHTIKPIDQETILASAKKTGVVLTAENHSIINGLGSAVAEILVENMPLPMNRVGVKDEFGEVGKMDYLTKRFELGSEDIVKAAKAAIARK